MVAHSLHGGLHGYLGVLPLGCKLVIVSSEVSRLETMLSIFVNPAASCLCPRHWHCAQKPTVLEQMVEAICTYSRIN
jgi:hypothetical protein